MNKIKRIRTGDKVMVIAGKDKGKTGTILEVLHAKNTVVVEGLNMRTIHTKPTQQDQEGGIKHSPGPLNISKVMLVSGNEKNPVPSKVTLTKTKNPKGRTETIRTFKKNGEEL
ncbi:MAG: 50S ribosomal protein L24 [Tenericutes bacterium]|nr:MAG: 50S ribosomal protein L24 [Mycoplasmatota bacterium]